MLNKNGLSFSFFEDDSSLGVYLHVSSICKLVRFFVRICRHKTYTWILHSCTVVNLILVRITDLILLLLSLVIISSSKLARQSLPLFQ